MMCSAVLCGAMRCSAVLCSAAFSLAASCHVASGRIWWCGSAAQYLAHEEGAHEDAYLAHEERCSRGRVRPPRREVLSRLGARGQQVAGSTLAGRTAPRRLPNMVTHLASVAFCSFRRARSVGVPSPHSTSQHATAQWLFPMRCYAMGWDAMLGHATPLCHGMLWRTIDERQLLSSKVPRIPPVPATTCI